MLLRDLALLSSLLFAGFLAGLFGMGTAVIQPAAASLPPGAHLLFRQQMIPRLHYLAPPIMLGALLSNLITVIFYASSWSWVFLVFNVVGYCACVLITLLGNVPLNHQFMKWKPESLPENWQELIHRWAVYDQIRFAISLLAFLSALVATGLAGLH